MIMSKLDVANKTNSHSRKWLKKSWEIKLAMDNMAM
jgi:hypothetical protein